MYRYIYLCIYMCVYINHEHIMHTYYIYTSSKAGVTESIYIIYICIDIEEKEETRLVRISRGSA